MNTIWTIKSDIRTLNIKENSVFLNWEFKQQMQFLFYFHKIH